MGIRRRSKPWPLAIRAYSDHETPRYSSSVSSRQLVLRQAQATSEDAKVTDQTIQPTPRSLMRVKSRPRSRHTPTRPFTGPDKRTADGVSYVQFD